MASPQLENGHTRIANEILEQISRVKLNGTQWGIVMTVWRYTYGFNRKSHAMSHSFIANAIGLSRPQVSREIKPLFEKNIIVLENDPGFSNSSLIAFNKDYETWKVEFNSERGNESVTPVTNPIPSNEHVTTQHNSYASGNESVTGGSNESVTERGNESVTQERKIKDNIKNKPKEKKSGARAPTRTQKKFVPPTVEQIAEYCKQRGNNIDPQRFFDHFSVADWHDSHGKPVLNWKQKIITWEGNRTSPAKGGTYASNVRNTPRARPSTDDEYARITSAKF